MTKNIIWTIFIVCITCVYSCGGNKTDATDDVATEQVKPWNISILCDLSDRITKESTGMSQVEKDIAVVSEIISVLKDKILKNKITQSEDKIKLYFYPSPSDNSINMKSKQLDIDFSKIEKGKKRKVLQTIDSIFKESLTHIYKTSLEEKKWIGCDIFGFFDTGKVQRYCVKDGYRNILVILSDGFIFHKDNKIKNGNKYSYILPQTLNVPNSELISCNPIVGDLDILFLEINANPSQSKRINKILSKWFDEMNKKKYLIEGTDLPSNTQVIISSFLKE